MFRFVLIVAVVSLVPTWAKGQVAGVPQDHTFFSDVDDSDQPYTLYLPRNYDPKKRYPLVISLHGAYSNNRLNMRRVFGKGNMPNETDVEATRYFPPLPPVDFIVASPLSRGSLGYQGIPEKDAYDVLSDVKKRYSVDDDRTYLTGLSMGGGGALWLGLTRPDLWAAVAAVSAYAPREAFDLAPNASNLNIRLFHGEADRVVPVAESRRWTQLFQTESAKTIEYNEFPGVGHAAWDKAYANAQIFKWFGRFKRDRYPARVRYRSRHYKYNKAYWVRLDKLTPGQLASVDASFNSPDNVSIRTGALDGFSLLLNGHPSYVEGMPFDASVDGQSVHIDRAEDQMSFKKIDNKWSVGKAELATNEKRPGLEGPLSAAISSRHIYVYGTADNPPPQELNKRRSEALQASNWAAPGVKLELWPRVVADRYVRQSDWDSSDIILFGDEKTNRVIQQLGAELPFSLKPGVKDYGLLYVWPHGNHYVVIVSGESIDQMLAHHGGRIYMPFMQAAFSSLPDFVVSHQSEHVIEGQFSNRWTVPADAADKLRQLDVVNVKSEGLKADKKP